MNSDKYALKNRSCQKESKEDKEDSATEGFIKH